MRNEGDEMISTRQTVLPILFLIPVVFILGVLGCSTLRPPDVEYVPTPHEVVAEMLNMAEVTQDDVVYDLGCGDGRIVIAAAKQYGARGVGVDIDPELIKVCQEKARKAGVTDRVRFLLKDLFETDIREATVVALYLTPELNLQLRPKLFHELKPGTRIVSHDFDMGEWKPDKMGEMRNVEFFFPDDMTRVRDTKFYYWVIPANIAGLWRWNVKTPGGERDYTLNVTQKFQEISGHVRAQTRESPISDGLLKGDQMSFRVRDEIAGQNVTMQFQGHIRGDMIDGSAEVKGGPFEGTHPWTAKRTR
jgi:SAM-dependent methyltransferase